MEEAHEEEDRREKEVQGEEVHREEVVQEEGEVRRGKEVPRSLWKRHIRQHWIPEETTRTRNVPWASTSWVRLCLCLGWNSNRDTLASIAPT